MAGVDPISSTSQTTSTASSPTPPSDIDTQNRTNNVFANNVGTNQEPTLDSLNASTVPVPPVVTPQMRAAAMSFLRNA